MAISITQKFKDFHNTLVLMKREEGQQIYAENGRLLVRSRAKTLSSKQRQETKALISSLLSRVEVGKGPLTESNVNAFVFEKIFPLHHSICDPSAMQKNDALRAVIAKRVQELKPEIDGDINIIRCVEKINALNKRIFQIKWQIFNPFRLDRKLEQELEWLKWLKSEDEKYCSALREAFLGLKMNLSHATGAEKKGWSGSFFWRSYLTNRTIGVYKPSDQDSLSPRSPHPFARMRLNLVPSSNGVLVSLSGKAHIAEAETRIAAEAFQRAYFAMQADGAAMPFVEEGAVVPDTRIVEMTFSSGATEQGIGSFQLFLDNCLPLTEAFGVDKKFKPTRKENLEVKTFLPHYQWLKLFHYLIFAEDDHAENTMAIKNGQGEIATFKAIDNGQSFPAKPLHPLARRFFSMKPLLGLTHPLAKEKLLPFFKDFLRRFRTEGHLDRLAKQFREFYQDPLNYSEGKKENATITEGRIRLLKERFAVLERLFVHGDEPLNTLLRFRKGRDKKRMRRRGNLHKL